MKKIIYSSMLVAVSGLLLSACSSKSFSLGNIKRHLTGSSLELTASPTAAAKPTTSPSVTKTK